MLFNTLHFLGFFVVVFGVYWSLRSQRRSQNFVLLVASAFFYGYWNWKFLFLILASTLIDFACGIALDRPGASTRWRKGILLASLVANLGVLGFFKYFGFFVDSTVELLEALGLGAPEWELQVLLPIGISFYTFQTLSYTIDRYRRTLPAERSLLNFALYVSFFPQLVAGPIVRAKEFLPMAAAARVFRWESMRIGLQLVLWGLFKKAVVADNLAPFIDGTFGSESALGAGVRLLAVYAFCIQIYCDFSGYTDIARGTAKLLGFEFPQNFRMPYFATNPGEFWRRWHITLSSWLRDYLYIPLGGNRTTAARTTRNLMITMVLGGLWHGAAWNFVLWGAYQGLLLGIHRALPKPAVPRHASWTWIVNALKWFVFFHLVNLGWLFFRAESLDQIVAFLTPSGVSLTSGLAISEPVARGLIFGGFGTFVVIVWDLLLARDKDAEVPLSRFGVASQVAACLFLYLSISLLGRFALDEFIYFQF